MTRATLLVGALSLTWLTSCAATLTLRNDRPGPVTDVVVKAAGTEYSVPVLNSGAQHVQKVKVKAGGDLNVNYRDEAGRMNYTSSKEPLKKGDTRKWLLLLDTQTLLNAAPEK
jgi:hypothetical protein